MKNYTYLVKSMLFGYLIFFISCNRQKNIEGTSPYTCVAKIYNDSLLVYSSLDSIIHVKNIKNKKQIYKEKVSANYCLQPVLNNSNLFFIRPNDKFVCVDIISKKTKWTYYNKGLINNFDIVNNKVILSIRDIGLISLDINTGKQLYEIRDVITSNFQSSIIYNFVHDEDNIYVSDFQSNTITAFAISNGIKKWKYKSEMRGLSKVTITKDWIFGGITGNSIKNEGKIFLLDKKTGNVIFEENKAFDLIVDPIIVGDKILYYTYDFKLNEFNLSNRNSKVIYNFNEKSSICGGQFFLLGNYIYVVDCNFMLRRLDLRTYKIINLRKVPKNINEVFYNNKSIEFVY